MSIASSPQSAPHIRAAMAAKYVRTWAFEANGINFPDAGAFPCRSGNDLALSTSSRRHPTYLLLQHFSLLLIGLSSCHLYLFFELGTSKASADDFLPKSWFLLHSATFPWSTPAAHTCQDIFTISENDFVFHLSLLLFSFLHPLLLSRSWRF